MFANKILIELDHVDDSVFLRPLGDIHLGNLACDEEKFLENINYIVEQPNYYTLGMGDYIDNVMAYAGGQVDKRYNPEITNRYMITTEEQLEVIRDLWTPLTNKTWGMLVGNHEWKTINQKRFKDDICGQLGVKYLGREAFIAVIFKHKGRTVREYRIHAFHGGYAGRTGGGVVNRLKQVAADFDADLHLMGHTHRALSSRTTRVEYDSKSDKIMHRRIILANTGTFLNSIGRDLDMYNEISPGEALTPSTITIEFKPYEGKIHVHE